LYYTASGIIKPIGGRPVHRLREDSDYIDYTETHGQLNIKVPYHMLSEKLYCVF